MAEGRNLEWHSDVVTTEKTVHYAFSEFGRVEIIEDPVAIVFNDKEEWHVFKWKAIGKNVFCTGTARSLERAKSDSLAAIELLDERTFDSAYGEDDED